MSNVRTLNSVNNKSSQNDWKNTTGHKLQDKNQTDELDCGSSTGNININTILPKDLKNTEVCLLFGQFLADLEDEDRESCFETLRKEKISGKTLVAACEYDKVMEELVKTLGFPFDFKIRFDDMINQIKKRLKELKKDNNEREHGKSSQTSTTNGTNKPQKYKQTISNTGCAIGEMNNHGENQKINNGCNYYNDVEKKSA